MNGAAQALADREDHHGQDRHERRGASGLRAGDRADDAESDSSDVVQLDEEERERDAVPERVDEPADLEGRDGTGEGREVGEKDAAHP